MSWNAPEQPASPPAQAPRAYPLALGWRVFLEVAAVGALVAAGFAIRDCLQPSTRAGDRWFVLLAGGFLTCLFLAGAVYAVRTRVFLGLDALGFRELRATRWLPFSAIEGVRVVRGQYGSYLVFVRRDGPKPFKVSASYAFDDHFRRWLATVPDLDAAERARSEAALLALPDLGSSPQARRARLERARRVGRWLQRLAVPATLWPWVYPRPYLPAVSCAALVFAAALALVLLGRGVYTVAEERNDARPSVVLALFGPGAALAMRATFDVQLVGWQRPLAWSAALAGVLIVLLVVADAGLRKKPWQALLFGPLLLMPCWGGLVLGNAELDRAPGVAFRAHMVEKHAETGKHRSWHLRLEPAPPAGGEPVSRIDPVVYEALQDVKVDRAFYETLQPGDSVRVRLRSGALGFPWIYALRDPHPEHRDVSAVPWRADRRKDQ